MTTTTTDRGMPGRDAPRPGALRNEAMLHLETRHAQSLLFGREPDPQTGRGRITGLDGFSSGVAQVWRSASSDDPYADHALLRIEKAIDEARRTIRAHTEEIAKSLSAQPEIQYDLARSVEPVQVPLRFSTPYGFLATQLLVDYDRLVRAILTARHVALVDREHGFRLLLRVGRPLRRTFLMPRTAWRYTGVTRADVRENRRLAQQAQALFAAMKQPDLPPAVLAGTERGRYAPHIGHATERRRAASYLEDEDDGKA